MAIKGSAVFDKDLRIRFRGLYDYDGLIALLRSFYARAKITIEEPKFKYKVGGNGAEVEFEFQGNLKVTHYIRVNLYVSGKAFDVDPKPVVIDGKKKMMTQGKIELKFQGSYELDYPGMYKLEEDKNKNALPTLRNKALKQMKELIDNPDYGLAYGDNKALGKKNMQKLIEKFHKETKQFLGMECV
jgi:hypothetical protein